jgi:hypothetical protein
MLFNQYEEGPEKIEEALDDLWDYLKGAIYFGTDAEFNPRKQSEPATAVKRRKASAEA